MTKREHRRFTAEQKLEILKEADQPGVTVSEVCRRHALAVALGAFIAGERWPRAARRWR